MFYALYLRVSICIRKTHLTMMNLRLIFGIFSFHRIQPYPYNSIIVTISTVADPGQPLFPKSS